MAFQIASGAVDLKLTGQRRFGRGMDMAIAKVRKLGSVAAKAGGLIAAALGGIGVAAAIKAAASFETAEIAFTSMLGSAERAKALLLELERFAAGTPFEFKDLVQSARFMTAMGFEVRELIPLMTTLGDATAAMGGNSVLFDQVTRALGQMRAAGRVNAQDMNQLVATGLPVWQMLADAIGMTVAETRKLSEQGLIPAEQGITAILGGLEGRFAGAMAKMSQTVTGKFSNMKDAVGITLRKVGDQIVETFNVKGIIDNATATINSLVPTLNDIVRVFGFAAKFIMDEFSAALGFLGDMFTAVFGTTVGNALKGAWDWFKIGLIAIKNWRESATIAGLTVAKVFVDGFSWMQQNIPVIFANIWTVIKNFGTNWFAFVKEIVMVVVKAFSNAGKIIINFFKEVWARIRGEGSRDFLLAITKGTEDVLPKLKEIGVALTEGTKALPEFAPSFLSQGMSKVIEDSRKVMRDNIRKDAAELFGSDIDVPTLKVPNLEVGKIATPGGDAGVGGKSESRAAFVGAAQLFTRLQEQLAGQKTAKKALKVAQDNMAVNERVAVATERLADSGFVPRFG